MKSSVNLLLQHMDVFCNTEQIVQFLADWLTNNISTYYLIRCTWGTSCFCRRSDTQPRAGRSPCGF